MSDTEKHANPKQSHGGEDRGDGQRQTQEVVEAFNTAIQTGQRQIQELIDAFSATGNNQIEQTDAPTADPAVLSAYQGLVDALAGPAGSGFAFQVPPPAPTPWNVSGFDFDGPTVEPGTPGRDARDVALNTEVTATFSENMEKTSLANSAGGSSTFTLFETSTLAPVKARVGYTDASTGSTHVPPKATLTPSNNLKGSTNYTVVIRGGTGGATDRFGNPLTENEIWNFTTR